jgi:hypothetical protein
MSTRGDFPRMGGKPLLGKPCSEPAELFFMNYPNKGTAARREDAYNHHMPRSFIVLAVLIALLTTCSIEAADPRREEECRKIAEKIRQIEARMRQPYSAAQGVRYDQRLRELKEKRYRRCR